MQKRNGSQLSRWEWLSPIVLTLVILIVASVVLMELGVKPFSDIKSEIDTWIRHTRNLVFPQAETPVVTPADMTGTDVTPSYTAEMRTIGNWNYTVTNVQWRSNMVVVDLTVKNDGNETVPFGFSYQVEDNNFTSVYKLCAVDNLDTVYWDKSVNNTGVGFYNREFSPGQSVSGTIKYTVYSDATSVYMNLAVGGKPGAKLFYLGKPQEPY